jgi:hypothetical protein
MTLTELISIGATVVVSLGGGGVVVFGLSNWFGKLWADRLMESERHRYAIDLEQLRDSLRRRSDEALTSVRTQLDITKEALVREHTDRVTIYRSAIDPIVVIVAKFEMILLGRRAPLTTEELTDFEVQRMRVYASLAMHAPQYVMDAHDALLDEILAVVHDKKGDSLAGVSRSRNSFSQSS